MLKNSVYNSDNVITEYICPYCGDSSLSLSGQKNHVYRKHPEKFVEYKLKHLQDLKA